MSADRTELPSIVQLDRYRLWALIHAVELDLRNLWKQQVVRDRPEEDYLGVYKAKAEDNRQRGGDLELDLDEPLVSFLDFGDLVDLLAGRVDEFENPETAHAMAPAVNPLKSIIPVRNRIAHARPLPDRAVEEIIDALDTATSVGLRLEQVDFVSKQIRMDPDWLPGEAIRPQPWEPSERVLHNVPLPEHEDTGLLGRDREREKLFRELKARRYPTFSILGPGGFGKTALALEVLWKLIEEEDPYEAVLYASLKAEKLTPQGIQQLSDPLRTLSDAFGEIARPLSDEFDNAAFELADALKGIPALIVIDNLETDIGADLDSLVSSMPEDVTVLVTSRIGLPSGFGDRATRLEALAPGAAVGLFRTHARARDQAHLAQLEEEKIGSTCDRLGRSPLGIKWLISSVEAGVRIEALLEEPGDLIEFCVGNVFDSLSSNAKQVAAALAVTTESTSTQRLSLLTDTDLDHVRLAVRELQTSQLVTAVADSDGYEAFYLTEMAVSHADALEGFRGDLDEARRSALEWDAAEERRRRDETNLLNPNTVLLSAETDQESALLLRKALSAARRRDIPMAMEMISTAQSLAPEFYETYRCMAFVKGLDGDVDGALSDYLRSMELAPDEKSAARCKYHLANHLIRMKRSHDALKHAELSHRVLDLDGTKLLLGRTLLYIDEREEAVSLLQEVVQSASGRLLVMAMTALVNAWKREAEALTNDAQPLSGLGAAVEGLAAYDKRSSAEDKKLHEAAIACANEGLRAALRVGDPNKAEEGLMAVLESIQKNPAWKTSPERPYVQPRLEELAKIATGDVLERVATLLAGRASVQASARAGRVVARITDFKPQDGFGFASDSNEARYFVHRDALIEKTDAIFLEHGRLVSFLPDPASPNDVTNGNLQRALLLEVELPEAERADAVIDREGVVVYADRHRLIIRDNATDCGITVERGDGANVASKRAEVDDSVSFSLQSDRDGWVGFTTKNGDFRYSALTDSFRIM